MDSSNITLRPAVAWFAEQMERNLRKHDDIKTGWKCCSYAYLVSRAGEGLDELAIAVLDTSAPTPLECIIQEAADVANFAMMIADNARTYTTLETINLDRLKAYAALVGSHNYNLNTEESDRDYKIFVLPTFEDLYKGKQYSTVEIGPDTDYDVHDIRKLSLLIWKSNINFTETLFSEEAWITSEPWGKRMRDILERREELARINLPYLWDACKGMFHTKYNNLEKGTAGTAHLVEKYGYDTKQAQHCYRCLDFLERYAANKFTDFKQAIWYEEGPARDVLLRIRQGCYSLEEFRALVVVKLGRVSSLENLYAEQQPDQELKSWLDEQVKNLVQKTLY